MTNPYEGLQEIASGLPAVVQPLIVAVAATVPYIEGEGAAAFGVLAGVHPVVAGLAAATGNIACVVVVVLLGSRLRAAAVAHRARRRSAVLVTASTGATAARADAVLGTTTVRDEDGPAPTTGATSKGRRRLERWLVRFGVPGASLLAPLALPTMLTAATFVASGVRKEWVILWQVVAILLWTGAVTVAATGLLSVLTG